MHESIKGTCRLSGNMRGRDYLDANCPGCSELATCGTGQAIITILAFEDKHCPAKEGAGIGVEAALEAMRVPEVE